MRAVGLLIGLCLLSLPARALEPSSVWVLAMTWHPAFCETVDHARPECRGLGPADARFVLHGLWPQGGAYCGVAEEVVALDKAGRWADLPAPVLSPQTARRLDAVMPGRASHLDRHEWIKHGTCSGLDAEAYFALSADLAGAFRALPSTRTLSATPGRDWSYARLCDLFTQALGPGATKATWVKQLRLDDGRYSLTDQRLRLTPGADGRLTLDAEDLHRDGKSMGCGAYRVTLDRPGPG